ncbi:MAG: hypothetical protein H6546_05000 [Chitinophagales bacterium]|nr:hypothetical protein [Chitinophagales bacterium]
MNIIKAPMQTNLIFRPAAGSIGGSHNFKTTGKQEILIYIRHHKGVIVVSIK